MLGLPLLLVFVFGTRGWPQAIHRLYIRKMKQQAYTLPTATWRKRRQQLSDTAHHSLFTFFCPYVVTSPPCNDFPFSWAQCWKCAITVRQTRAQSKPVWLIVLVPVQECCFRYLLRPILILLALGLRHDSDVKGKVGENHGRQWGVSLTVRKTAREDWAGWVHLHPVVWLLFSCFNVIQKESGTFGAIEETRAGRVRETKVFLLELFSKLERENLMTHLGDTRRAAAWENALPLKNRKWAVLRSVFSSLCVSLLISVPYQTCHHNKSLQGKVSVP